MPRTSVGAADKQIVTETTKSDEPVDLDEDEDPEEEVEEEVEYEEVEVEEEEEEEEEEDEEEEVEEEVEEEDEEDNKGASEDRMKVAEDEEGKEKKHAELLALPPHGSDMYLGGIPNDATEDDLRAFCESVGEVTEVICNYMKFLVLCLYLG